MDGLAKVALKVVGYLFAILVIAFTGFQSWSLLYEVSGNAAVATLGVVLFEGGMVYWWFAFQKDAEGLGQMAVSLMGAVFGLILVGGATALHLGAIEGNTFGANTPQKLVTLAAIVNLVLKFVYPLLSPDTFSAIWEHALEGKVSAKAFKEADTQVNDMAGELADMIGQEMKRRLRVKMLTNYGLYQEPVETSGTTEQLPATATPQNPPLPAAQPDFLAQPLQVSRNGNGYQSSNAAGFNYPD